MKTKNNLPKGITQRSDGRYQATYYLNNKRKYLYDMNLETLELRLRDVRYEIEHGIYANPGKLKLNTWFDIWMQEYKQFTLKDGTIENYQKNYKLYIKPYIGDMYIRDIRIEHVQKLYNDLKRSGYKTSTLNVSRGVLSGMFSQLMKNGLVNKNPMPYIEFPKEKVRRIYRVLAPEEQMLFLRMAKGSDYEDFYRLALSTGLRIGELCALLWEDIDLNSCMLNVSGNLKYFSERGFVRDTPKSLSSNRSVPLLPAMVQMLRNRRLQQNQERLHLGDVWNALPGFERVVFTNPNMPGEPVRKRTIAHDLDVIVRKMNQYEEELAQEEDRHPVIYEHITPHALRHTFATRALENGIPPKVVQDILGHSSIKMTLDLYTHVLPQTKSMEIQKIAGLV